MKDNKRELLRIHHRLETSDQLEHPPGGPGQPPLDDAFFERMHDKIMAQVAMTEVEPKKPMQSQVLVLSRYWRKYSRPAARATMTLSLALVGIGFLATQLTRESPALEKEPPIVQESVNRAEDFSTSLLNDRSVLDFVSDVASHSQSKLTAEDLL